MASVDSSPMTSSPVPSSKIARVALSSRASAFTIAALMGDVKGNSRDQTTTCISSLPLSSSASEASSVKDELEGEGQEDYDEPSSLSPSPPAAYGALPEDGHSSHGNSLPLLFSPSSSSPCKELACVQCRLETENLWDKFHALGTEMIITKSGR